MIVAQKNKDVQLTCIVENKPENSQVQWMSTSTNGTVNQIASSTQSFDAFRWAIDNPSPTAWRLRIQNAQVADEGLYTCQVQVASQNYIKSSKELKIVEIPEISDIETSSDMTKNVGDAVDLECYATGRPTPVIKWTRIAGELLPSGGKELVKEGLRIDSVEGDHAGEYKCTAQNSAGIDVRTIRLTVNYPPIVTISEPLVRQKPGYVKEMVCNVKAYPPPTPEQITWTREGMPVRTQGRFTIRSIPGASNCVTSVVVIWGVRREDFGRYTCSATNSKGTSEAFVELAESPNPTADRTGIVRAGASIVSINIATVVMFVSVCLLQRIQLH